jgi:cobalamin biosynthesis Mg chelatase CobN
LLSAGAALAAFALFPVIARAESNSEKVYHLAPPTIKSTGPEQTGKSEARTKSHPGTSTTPERDGSTTPTQGEETAVETATEDEREPGSKERHKSRTAPLGKGDNHPRRGGGGRGDGASSKASDGPGPDGTSPTRTEASRSDGGGGSSPAVAFLIAVVVLAAVSIGVVLYRERRPA